MVRQVLADMDDIEVSISYTTRPMRPSDQEGVDYFFVDEARFLQMIEDKSFLEHAEVFGHRYGTSSAWVLDKLSCGRDIILEIDWQGARLVRQLFSGAVSIYILPPSLQALQQRLRLRAEDSDEVITGRMDQAQSEMSHCYEFDYIIINDDLGEAVDDLKSIIRGRRLRFAAQAKQHAKLVEQLLENG